MVLQRSCQHIDLSVSQLIVPSLYKFEGLRVGDGRDDILELSASDFIVGEIYALQVIGLANEIG